MVVKEKIERNQCEEISPMVTQQEKKLGQIKWNDTEELVGV